MNYWLIKSEAEMCSIEDLKHDKVTSWEEIRNYQARNYMRQMKKGDLLLFYHSMSKPTGVAGIAKVASDIHPDMSQFDTKSEYFDPKATDARPIWECVDVQFVEKFKDVVTLDKIKTDTQLDGMLVRAKGSRLSVQPVSKAHFEHICSLGRSSRQEPFGVS
jgi:predicted RNA-binding protein with PUA-like domain